MIPIPYLKEGMAAVIIVLIAALTWTSVSLRITKADLRTSKSEEVRLTEQVLRAGQQMLTLREKIDQQNESIEAAEEIGAKAQAAINKVAEYSRRIARAEEELNSILQKNQDLKERTKDLPTCETYELVLRSIAGSLP